MGTHPIFESDFDCLTDFLTDFRTLSLTTGDISLDFSFRVYCEGIGPSNRLSTNFHRLE